MQLLCYNEFKFIAMTAFENHVVCPLIDILLIEI